jgi:hypothetical protein
MVEIYDEQVLKFHKRKRKSSGGLDRGKMWWISYFVGGRQRFESSRSTKKRDARELLDIRKGDAREGRLRLTSILST